MEGVKMDWKDIGKAIGKFAPMVGTVIGGPAGAAVGSLVSTVLGVENEPDAIHKALQVDPEAAIKLQSLQNENMAMLKKHIEAMATIDLKYEDSRVEERKSAHAREVGLATAGKSNYIQPVLAAVGVIAFFGLAGYVVTSGLPDMSKEEAFIIGSVIGSVMMIAKDIYGYYFGSSSGSKEKTAHLAAKEMG